MPVTRLSATTHPGDRPRLMPDEAMRSVLRGFMDTVEFPVLMANADVSAEPALAGVLKPSVIIERGGSGGAVAAPTAVPVLQYLLNGRQHRILQLRTKGHMNVASRNQLGGGKKKIEALRFRRHLSDHRLPKSARSIVFMDDHQSRGLFG